MKMGNQEGASKTLAPRLMALRFDRAFVRASGRGVGGHQSFHFPWLQSKYSMATLTKSHTVSQDDNLASSIPAPFSPADRAYIRQSSHTTNPHHSITPKTSTHEHPPRTQEAQAPEEVLPNVDRESPTAIQVRILLYICRSLICDLPSRIKMSCLQ